MKKNNGFTLIEILIALVIFAIVGVMAAMSLHSMIRTNHALKLADRQLMQLQITMTLLRRDTMQMINRPVMDTDGSQQPAMLAPGDTQIYFTRMGFPNPFQVIQQSDLRRVGYTLQGDQLVRLTWDVLDRPPDAKPEIQVLLDHVQSLQWQFMAGDGHNTSIWPPAFDSVMQRESDNSPLPRSITMVMHIQGIGLIQMVFPVPARGVYANTMQ